MHSSIPLFISIFFLYLIIQMVLKDHNVASSDGVKEPTALVHVVESAYLTKYHPDPPFQRSCNWYVFLIVVRMGCTRVWDELFCHRRYVLVIIQKSIKPKLIIHPPTVSEYKFLVSVCDRDNNKILITENVLIETKLSDELMAHSFWQPP